VRAEQQRAALAGGRGRAAGAVAGASGGATGAVAGPSGGIAWDAGEQVAAIGARAGAGIVLVRGDAERAQLGDHAFGARPLAAGGALDPAQLGERPVQVAALELAHA